MSDFIKINSTGKKIQVNDSGDFIMLELKNTTFMNNLIILVKEFEAASGELSERLSRAENGSIDEASSVIAQAAEVCVNLAARTDEVFGAGTCRKVFGEQAPGIYEFADFFEQIGGLIQEYAKKQVELNENVAKYKEKYSRRE